MINRTVVHTYETVAEAVLCKKTERLAIHDPRVQVNLLNGYIELYDKCKCGDAEMLLGNGDKL